MFSDVRDDTKFVDVQVDFVCEQLFDSYSPSRNNMTPTHCGVFSRLRHMGSNGGPPLDGYQRLIQSALEYDLDMCRLKNFKNRRRSLLILLVDMSAPSRFDLGSVIHWTLFENVWLRKERRHRGGYELFWICEYWYGRDQLADEWPSDKPSGRASYATDCVSSYHLR